MARLLGHGLLVALLLGALSSAARGALRAEPASPRSDPATADQPAHRLARSLFAEGHRFIAAELGRVAPATADRELVATLAAVTHHDAERPAVTVWDRLADCESGDWHDGAPQPGTARWDYGLAFSHGDVFEGGVNFHPRTWDAYRGAGTPDHAGRATRAQQIAVARRVLGDQGWGAWPVCSRKLGLR